MNPEFFELLHLGVESKERAVLSGCENHAVLVHHEHPRHHLTFLEFFTEGNFFCDYAEIMELCICNGVREEMCVGSSQSIEDIGIAINSQRKDPFTSYGLTEIGNSERFPDLDLLRIRLARRVFQDVPIGRRAQINIASIGEGNRVRNRSCMWNQTEGLHITVPRAQHEEVRAGSACGPIKIAFQSDGE